jgi:hypothetical protein
VVLELLARCRRTGGEILLGDRGDAGREFAHAVRQLDATIVRPRGNNEAGPDLHLAPIRQPIEWILWTCKDLLVPERYGARTLCGLRERVLRCLFCLVTCISLNHKLGRRNRALVDDGA